EPRDLSAPHRVAAPVESSFALLSGGVAREETPAGGTPRPGRHRFEVIDVRRRQRSDRQLAVGSAFRHFFFDSLRIRLSACSRQRSEPRPSSTSVSIIWSARSRSPRRSRCRAYESASFVPRALLPS